MEEQEKICGEFINNVSKFWSEIPEVFLTHYTQSYTIIDFLFSLEILNCLQVTNNPQFCWLSPIIL